VTAGVGRSGQRTLRPAHVRYYIDADVLGLAKLLVQIRNDVTYPGDPGGDLHRRQRPPCPITEARTLDTVWIPTTAANDWLIITRDSNIAVNRAEIAAVRESGARMVALAGKEAIGTWAQLEVLMTRWRSIEALLDEPGPFIYFGHSDSAAAHRPWVVACVGQSAKKLPGRGNGSSKEKPSAQAHPLTSSPSEVAPSSNGASTCERSWRHLTTAVPQRSPAFDRDSKSAISPSGITTSRCSWIARLCTTSLAQHLWRTRGTSVAHRARERRSLKTLSVR
jgi:hypothetical protein